MPELMLLRELTEQVVPPHLDDLRSVARARRRRSAVLTAAVVGATVTAAVVTTLALLGTDDRTAPVTPTPTPTQEQEPGTLTAREVVEDPEAQLAWAATAWSDPDVRISAWTTVCGTCPKRFPDARSRPSFSALALTTDGYDTTSYVTTGIADGVYPDVTSPTDDVFLVNDSGNGREWLVTTEGTVTPVDRTDVPIDPVDERHWFECGLTGRRGPQQTWCTIDVATATAYAWPDRWGGGLPSGARPDSGVEPWGIENGADGNGLDAWWEVAGERRAAPLTDGVELAGIVRSSPTGGPLWWTKEDGSDELVLHDGRDRTGTWDEVVRPAPGTAEWFGLTGTPAGALLAWSTWPTVAVWRADDLTADFEQVYAGEPREDGLQPSGSALVAVDGRLLLGSLGQALTSEDDGRTWSVITTWR